MPRVLGTFEDDFEQIANGWVAAGGISHLEKRDQDLQVTFAKRQGNISRNVDWDLTDPGYTYIAVFELAGRNIKSGRISLLSSDGETSRPFWMARDPSLYRFVNLELNPGHYTTIKITADPGAVTGRVHLHTYRLYAIPKGDLPAKF